MRIKIRTALCMGLLLAICLTGCGTGYSVEKDYIIPVLDALEEGDAETIYDMFAPDVRKAETFLQEDAETLAGMYEGELVTYRIVDGSTSNRGKKSGYRKKFTATCEVRTTEGEYMLRIAARPQGTTKNNTGVYAIALIRVKDYLEENELLKDFTANQGIHACGAKN